MNLTQSNDEGCHAVVAAEGVEVLAQLLIEIAHGSNQRQSCLDDAKELDTWVDELSGCLGVLINIAEHRPDTRQRMRAFTCAIKGGEDTAKMMTLLCRLVSTAHTSSEEKGGGVDGDGQPTADEVTLDTLETGEEQGAGLIVEVYAAILLGFLIDGDAGAQSEAAALLPGGTLDPVIAAVARCLQFYINAGAITSKTEGSLRRLLASLKESKG